MKKEYIFEMDYFRGNTLRATGGFYDYQNSGKYIYKRTDKASEKELKKVEKLGDNFKSVLYVLYLNIKYNVA